MKEEIPMLGWKYRRTGQNKMDTFASMPYVQTAGTKKEGEGEN